MDCGGITFSKRGELLMADYLTTDTELTSIANAIRTKGGTSASLSYPTEFVTAIQNLPTGGANLQTKSKTYTPSGSQQTDTITPDSGYDGMSSVGVTVNAVPTADVNGSIDHAEYVTVSNQRKWRVYAGAYAETEGWIDEGATGLASYDYNAIPSNTSVTPSTSSQTVGGANYMMEGAVTVNPIPSQYIVPSGSRTVAGNGTFDVTNYAQVIVDTPTMTLPSTTSSSSSGTRKAGIWPSTSQQYLNIPAGLNETAQYYQIFGMELAPLNVTQNGTYNASDVDITGFNTVTVNVPTGSANLQSKTATYTPTTSQQTATISPDNGYDGLSSVGITVNPIPSQYIVPSGSQTITENGTVDVTNLAEVVVNVGGKNIQYMMGRYEVQNTSYVSTNLHITVSKAGTYKCYWCMDRNTTSGTTGTRLYKNGTAIGGAHTTWTNSSGNARNGMTCEETQTFQAGDVLNIYARSRSTSYICGVANFIIIEQ